MMKYNCVKCVMSLSCKPTGQAFFAFALFVMLLSLRDSLMKEGPITQLPSGALLFFWGGRVPL